MSYEFKQAVRESVGLLIGLIGPSGSGKTFSAMRIAAGIVGAGNRFAVIDTENRRALHYASQFQFDHCELSAPFKSANYADAIKAADMAGYKAIVVDSCSHEWAGEGGVLDFQEAELTRMAGDDYKKRESCKMASWIKPKMQHKQMVQRLLQTKAHLILCFRAEEKMKMEKDQKGTMQIIPVGFQPVCSKEMPYELTVSFLLSHEKPGIGQPIKLQEQHKNMFPVGKLLDETAGEAIKKWAEGGVKQTALPQEEKPKEEIMPSPESLLLPPKNPQEPIMIEEPQIKPVSKEQKAQINGLMEGYGITVPEDKKALYDYVMTKNDYSLADRFILQFEKYYRAYSRKLDADAEGQRS